MDGDVALNSKYTIPNSLKNSVGTAAVPNPQQSHLSLRNQHEHNTTAKERCPANLPRCMITRLEDDAGCGCAGQARLAAKKEIKSATCAVH